MHKGSLLKVNIIGKQRLLERWVISFAYIIFILNVLGEWGRRRQYAVAKDSKATETGMKTSKFSKREQQHDRRSIEIYTIKVGSSMST